MYRGGTARRVGPAASGVAHAVKSAAKGAVHKLESVTGLDLDRDGTVGTPQERLFPLPR